MKTEWSETAIRKELARLDEKTGLHGARLPISFSRAYTIIGQFSARGEGEFRFSTVYFRDPTWPVEEALNVIRHEYAHYMDYALYDGAGHGSTWKKCCTMIGAVPQRCYSSRVARLLKEKHDEEAKLSQLCDAYHVGDVRRRRHRRDHRRVCSPSCCPAFRYSRQKDARPCLGASKLP